MIVTMAGQFVPAFHNGSHGGLVALSHPAQCEECRFHPGGVEQIEDAADIIAHAQLQRIPVAAVDGLLKSTDLKPVFDIDRHAVDDPVGVHVSPLSGASGHAASRVPALSK